MVLTLSEILTLPSIGYGCRDQLPKLCGLYFVTRLADTFDPTYEQPAPLLYIGESVNIRQRWKNHHRAPQMLPYHLIRWIACADEDERLASEKAMVQEHQPPWNGLRVEQCVRDLSRRVREAEQEIFFLREELRIMREFRQQPLDPFGSIGFDV